MYWVQMLKNMKEDTLELPRICFTELMVEYFYISRNIKLSSTNDLFKYTFQTLIYYVSATELIINNNVLFMNLIT